MAQKKSAPKKKGAKRSASDPGPDTVPNPGPDTVPPPSPQEVTRIVRSFVGELQARPDAQVQIVRDAIPSLTRILGVDIPTIDLNPREQAAPPAPGPMTRNVVVDPRAAVNATGPEPVVANPAAGGIEAQNIVAVGEALESVNKDAAKPAKAAKKKAASKKK